MALIDCRFFSESLGEATAMLVIVPTLQAGYCPRQKKKDCVKPWYQTLYLLHGLSDDHSAWQRQTNIERYAQENCLAVVMPAAGKSFYTDMARGGKYWTFVSEEVPRVARALFPLSARREDNFVAGVSMGGYGAFKMALTCPDRYAAAASISGVADLEKLVALIKEEPALKKLLENVFGDPQKIKGSRNDLFYLLKKLKHYSIDIPLLYQACGQDDPNLHHTVEFGNYAVSLGAKMTVSTRPGGHDWAYWDEAIRDVLDWLPLQQRTVE